MGALNMFGPWARPLSQRSTSVVWLFESTSTSWTLLPPQLVVAPVAYATEMNVADWPTS